MVYVTDTESWQRIFQLAAENSRWDLTDPDVARYMERSYDFIIDFLRRVDYSEPYALDPAGDEALRLAKEVRRDSRKAGMEFRMAEEATRQFAMPESRLRFALELGAPLYCPRPREPTGADSRPSGPRVPSTSSSRAPPARPAASCRPRGSATLRRDSPRTPDPPSRRAHLRRAPGGVLRASRCRAEAPHSRSRARRSSSPPRDSRCCRAPCRAAARVKRVQSSAWRAPRRN